MLETVSVIDVTNEAPIAASSAASSAPGTRFLIWRWKLQLAEL